MTTSYRNANGPVNSQTYGNGASVRYVYDKEERVTGIYKTNSGTEVKASENVYDKNGVLICHKDLENAQESRYHYDLAGRITGLTKEQTGGKELTLRAGYDDKDRVSAHTQKLAGSAAVKNSYRYGNAEAGEEPGLIYGMSVNGTERETFTYDGLGRIVKKTLHLNNGAKWETEYTYCKGGLNGSTTLLVESVKDKDKTLFYTYDEVGNIVKVEEMAAGSTSKVQKASYTYDHLGQLIRENNAWTGETVVYAYDKGGNMLTKKVYDHTTGEITSAMSPKDTAGYSYEKPNAAVI